MNQPIDSLVKTNTNRRSIQILRWVGTAVAVTAALYSLNLAAYHAWAASFPATPSREWHVHWSNIFFALALVLFVLAGFVAWRLRRRSPSVES